MGKELVRKKMGKNKKSTVTIDDYIYRKNGIEIDSNEEYYVYNWLMEAYTAGIVKEYEYQPPSFKLTEKFKYVPAFGNPKQKEKHLLADHEYTADFRIVFNRLYGERLVEYFKIPVEAIDANGDAVVWIDVKAGFNRFGGDRNFSIHQKMMWDKHKIYVQKVVPEELFKKLGAPEAAKYTVKTKKPTAKYAVGAKSIKEAFA